MSIKVQYNPSTGKASYNPVTSNVQVVVGPKPLDCEYCEDTPYQVKVTFSDVIIRDGCYAASSHDHPRDLTWINVPDINTEFILTAHPSIACRWDFQSEEYTADWPQVFVQASSDGSCTGYSSTAYYKRLKITLTLNASGINLHCYLWLQDTPYPVTKDMFVQYKPVIDSCVDVGDVENAEISTGINASYDGTALVENA